MNDAKATEETKAAAETKAAETKAAAKSAEDVAAIEAAHAAMETARDGRDIGDIPMRDPYWAALAAFQITAADKDVNFNAPPPESPVVRDSGKGKPGKEASPF